MKTSEILTLLKAGTDRKAIRMAEIAGRMETVVHSAERKIDRAEHFGGMADWTEVLRIMEGMADAEREWQGARNSHNKETD